LNLATAEAPLEMEMKTYQREGYFNRLVVCRSVLRCKSVDRMLMDEICAAVSQVNTRARKTHPVKVCTVRSVSAA
jgi:hypothetical protein